MSRAILGLDVAAIVATAVVLAACSAGSNGRTRTSTPSSGSGMPNADQDRPPAVLVPSVPLTPSVPLLPSTSLPSTGVEISSTPVETRSGVELFSVAVGQLTFLAPGSGDGWRFVDASAPGVPPLIRFSNSDGTSLIVLNTVTADTYWYISQSGGFDEVQMRITRDGGVFVADRNVLRTAYGDASDIPWYVTQSIALIPSPTPAPATTAGPVDTAKQ